MFPRSTQSITYATSPDIPGQIGAYLGDRDGNNATVQAASRNKTLVTVWAGERGVILEGGPRLASALTLTWKLC